MGTYTEFHFSIKLAKDTPKPVIDFLVGILGPQEGYSTPVEHNFFKCERWPSIFSWHHRYDKPEFYPEEKYPRLYLQGELKNYDHEIQEFVDFISPYVAGRKKKQYLGWSKVEGYESQQKHHYAKRL